MLIKNSVLARADCLGAHHQHASADLGAAVRDAPQRDPEGQGQELALQLLALSVGKRFVKLGLRSITVWLISSFKSLDSTASPVVQ